MHCRQVQVKWSAIGRGKGTAGGTTALKLLRVMLVFLAIIKVCDL